VHQLQTMAAIFGSHSLFAKFSTIYSPPAG
jgi:hypothetical protein